MRKAGIPFGLLINVDPDKTGLAATLTASYRLQGATGEFTVLPGTFVEIKPGSYELMVTFATEGYYDVNVSSSSVDPVINGGTSVLPIGKASVDDIFAAVAAQQLDVTDIKTRVAALDINAVNAVKAGVDESVALLTELKLLVNDTESSSITSLRELLIEIGNSETASTGLINAIKSISEGVTRILLGVEPFLADGTTPNPHYQATNVELKSLITTSTEALQSGVTAAKEAVLLDAQAKHDLVLTKVAAVDAMVKANGDLLANAGYGLSALKTILDEIKVNTAGGTQTIIDVLNNAENGLAALKAQGTSILTAVGGVDTKVSAIASDITAIKTGSEKSASISFGM